MTRSSSSETIGNYADTYKDVDVSMPNFIFGGELRSFLFKIEYTHEFNEYI